MNKEIRKMAAEIIDGRRLSRGEDMSIMWEAELTELVENANRIREALCGNHVELCSIINGRSGRCSENCKFCAQSRRHGTEIREYSFLDVETIVEDARKHEAKGVRRYSVVTAGRCLGGDFEKALRVYEAIHKACPGLELCASHGLLNREEFEKLKTAGVTRYHANLETSQGYFPQICTTHTYDDKIRVIRTAQEAGLEVCSGGIIGMGETWEDRLDMAAALSELGVVSIPVNVLSPIPGTPLENCRRLSREEILRTIAIVRYWNPTARVRIAAGRFYFEDGGACLFTSGANAAITGDMLTTVGNTIDEDRRMLLDMGFSI